MKNIIQDTETILRTKQEEEDWEKRFSGILQTVIKNQQTINASRNSFRNWGWLRAYMNCTQAQCKYPEFSLRYGGQQVGTMRFQGGESHVFITPKESSANQKFGLMIPSGTCNWKKSSEAKTFRKSFKSAPSHVRVDEHRYESLFLDEMYMSSSNKFEGTFGSIQPVHIAKGIPFQIPLPVSANTGAPVYTDGHIDILARVGKGMKTDLVVIELKRPNNYAHAASQAVIYATTLLYMLQKSSLAVQQTLWKLCGFGRRLTPDLRIKAAVAIDKRHEDKFIKERTSLTPYLKSSNIDLHYMFYELTNKNRIRIDSDL